jgi:hypothetical protein
MRLDERNDLSLFVEMIGGIAESQCEFSDVPDLLESGIRDDAFAETLAKADIKVVQDDGGL